MRSIISTSALAALLASGAVQAGGLDRSGQDTSIIFKEGGLFEVTSVSVKPTVTGTYDATLTALGGATATGDVTPDYSMTTMGFKMDVSDNIAVALVQDSPYGAHVKWTGGFLDGTEGKVDSSATTLMASYGLGDAVSLYGGLKSQKMTIKADINLPFPAPDTLAYSLSETSSNATGYLLGAAFEKPEIALRVAFTYHPKVKHDFTTVESVNTNPVNSTASAYAPSAYNIDFQTGVAENTLLFGSIRKVNWTETDLKPTGYNMAASKSLLSYDEDTTTYSIGLGRKFTENWSAALTYGYEGETAGDGSPLAPTNGNSKYGLGVTYNAEAFSATIAAQKVNMGNQSAAVSTFAAAMADNSALVTAFKISARF